MTIARNIMKDVSRPVARLAIQEEVVYAKDYGFLPTSTGAENVAAFNSIGGNKRILITISGTYEIDGTLWIESNTTIEWVEACTIKKMPNVGTPYTHVFANAGYPVWTRNENISIYGNGLIVDQNGEDGVSATEDYRMRGMMNFFGVDNLILDGFVHSDGGANEFFSHGGDLNNFSITNMNIETLKAAFQFQGKCFDGLLENIVTDTLDDALALNAIDFPIVMATVGNIERLTIRNWTDNQVVHGWFANGCRVMPGSWADWNNGNTYNLNDTVANAGNIYTKSSAGADVAANAPTHSSGKVTGADGIEWWWVQVGTETEALVKDITYKDCNINTDGPCIGLTGDNDVNQRSIYPGTEGNGYLDNLVLDNVQYNPPNGDSAVLFSGFGFTKKITIRNSIMAPVSDCILIYGGHAINGVYDGTLDEAIIDNCDIELNAGSSTLVKINTCAGEKVTINNSTIVLDDTLLLDYTQLDGERNADIILDDVSVTGMSSLTDEGHCYDMDITADDCQFINVGRVLYRSGTAGNGVTYTSVGCSYADPSEDFLFKSADNKLTIDVSNSTGDITQSKILDANVVNTHCDLIIPAATLAEARDTGVDEVTITFDYALDDTIVPAASAFAVSGKTVSGVAISGNVVTLTTTEDILTSDTPLISYTVPTTNKLKGLITGLIASFTNMACDVLSDEMIDQDAWYTLAYWADEDANWSQVGNTLVSDGSGAMFKYSFWTVGWKVKTKRSGIRSGAGCVRTVWDAVSASIICNVTVTDKIEYIDSVGTVHMRNTSSSYQGSITALSCKRVMNP